MRFGNRLACEIPILCYDTEKLRGELRELYDKGVRSVVAENIGALKIAKDMGFTVHGGSGLNILNTLALEEYAAIGLEDATVSFELSANHIAELGGTLKRGILGYGRLPLMQLRACPARGKSGCEKNCPGKMELTDRKNRRFLLLCREKKFSTLYNCVPLYIGDRKERFPVDFFTLYFTDETKKQAEAVYWDFNSGKPYHAERTKGLYFREVE